MPTRRSNLDKNLVSVLRHHKFVACAPSADKLLPWVYPKVDCRLAFVDTSHRREEQGERNTGETEREEKLK